MKYKYNILSRNRECEPRTVKLGNFYLFIDSKVLRKRVNAKVNEINEKSILPAPVLSEYQYEKTGSLLAESSYIENYMSFDFYCEDYFVSFSGYPIDEDHCRLTNIELLTEKYNIYGIAVGMRVNIAENTLKEYGFLKSADNETECYCFPGMSISFSVSNEILTQINLDIKSYYVGNYLY